MVEHKENEPLRFTKEQKKKLTQTQSPVEELSVQSSTDILSQCKSSGSFVSK